VERHEIMELLGQLKLAGMRAAYDELVAAGVRAQHPFQRIFGELCSPRWPIIELARPAYRLGVARFPVMKNLAEFHFAGSPVDQGLVRELHEGGFLAPRQRRADRRHRHRQEPHRDSDRRQLRAQRRSRALLHRRRPGNQLEAEARAGKAGKLADQLVRVDLVILDELGYLPFPVSGGQMLFHLISRLYERTSARRARVPSVDSGDDRYSTAGVGRNWALIPGPAWP
jgi:hypothetical protein